MYGFNYLFFLAIIQTELQLIFSVYVWRTEFRKPWTTASKSSPFNALLLILEETKHSRICEFNIMEHFTPQSYKIKTETTLANNSPFLMCLRFEIMHIDES